MAGSVISVGTTVTQLPFTSTGVTVVNLGTETVTLSTAATFSTLTSYTIGPKSAMPVPVGPIYAKTTTSANVLVIPKLLNISNPNVKITGQTINIGTITGTVKVTVSGGNLNISGGTLNVGSITDTVTVGGSVTSLQQNGAVYAVGDKPVLLATGTLTATATDFTISVPSTKVTLTFSAIQIVATCSPTIKILCAVVSSAGLDNQSVAAFGPPQQVPPVSVAKHQATAIVPVAIKSGSAIVINLYAAKMAGLPYRVLGLTSNPGVQLRSDGRTYPIGSHTAEWQSTAGGTDTLIPAPAAPLRIMLRQLILSATSSTTYFNAHAGTTVKLGYLVGGGLMDRQWDSGKLLPVNTALTVSPTAGKVSAYADYDIIV